MPEKKLHYLDRVRIGIGETDHRAALYKAGCEKVFTGDEEIAGFFGFLGTVLREGDVLMVVSPAVLDAEQMQQIGKHGIAAQVVGHEPMQIDNPAKRQEFRRLKQIVAKPVPRSKGGRPPLMTATPEQVASLVTLWNSGLKRALVMEQAAEIMGRPVPEHWLKYQIEKATGTLKRARSGKEAGK